MLLKKKFKFVNTVVFRLTITFTFLFTIFFGGVYFTTKKMLERSLLEKVDNIILQEVKELEEVVLSEGLSKLEEEILEESKQEGIERIFIKLYNSNLDEVYSSDLSHWKYLHAADLKSYLVQTSAGDTLFNTIASPNPLFDARLLTKVINNGSHIVQFAIIMKDDKLLKEKFSHLFEVTVLLMLGVSICLGWLISFKAMQGVRRVTKTAIQIGRNGFHHRVQVGVEGEEIIQLSNAFNDMLNRIEFLMDELKDVTNNVAHDLRTPITRIQGIVETTLRGKLSLEEMSEGYSLILEECIGIKELINTVLEIAEAESKANLKEPTFDKFDAMVLLKKSFEVFFPVAQDKDIQMVITDRKEPLYLYGDIMKFQRLIASLLDNAIKFTNSNGLIEIQAIENEGNAEISIIDSGIGIESIHLQRIFEKFYRVETSRSTEGNGLGLSWVYSVAHSLGWSIYVDSKLGKGSKFTLKIPLKPNS